MDEKRPTKTTKCWLCGKPLRRSEARSLLGLGVLLVHRECRDRDSVGKTPAGGEPRAPDGG